MMTVAYEKDRYLVLFPLWRLHAQYFSWPVMTRDAIDFIKEKCDKQHILSVGSGTGFIESLLHRYGLNIKCTDVKLVEDAYMDIEKIDAVSAVAKYEDYDVLFCSYPAELSTYLTESLNIFKGFIFILVGHYRKITGDQTLFDLIETKFMLDSEFDLPKWLYNYTPYDDGCFEISPKIFIYKRK
jgi:hypothetical protein